MSSRQSFLHFFFSSLVQAENSRREMGTDYQPSDPLLGPKENKPSIRLRGHCVFGEGAVNHAAVANEKLLPFYRGKVSHRSKDKQKCFRQGSVLSSEKAVATVGGGPDKSALLLRGLYIGTWPT